MVKRESRKKKIVHYALIITVIFFLCHRTFVRTPGRLEQWALAFAYPFVYVQAIIVKPFYVVQNWFVSHTALMQQIKLLHTHNQSLQAELLAVQSSQNFLEETHELRVFNKRYQEENMQLAHIVLRHFENEHFFLIDAGTQKNIKTNMVVVFKNCLVGKVTQVYPFYSKVSLITDPACQVACYCAKTKTVGIYQGMRNLEMGSLLHVDHLAKLKVGDQVISSGEGLVFPSGFGIGEIQDFKDTGVHYAVTVKPLIDVSQLSYCYVLQKGATS